MALYDPDLEEELLQRDIYEWLSAPDTPSGFEYSDTRPDIHVTPELEPFPSPMAQGVPSSTMGYPQWPNPSTQAYTSFTEPLAFSATDSIGAGFPLVYYPDTHPLLEVGPDETYSGGREASRSARAVLTLVRDGKTWKVVESTGGSEGERKLPEMPKSGWTPLASAKAGLTFKAYIENLDRYTQVSWHDPTSPNDHYVTSKTKFSDAQLVCAVSECEATLDLTNLEGYDRNLEWKFTNVNGAASAQVKLNWGQSGQLDLALQFLTAYIRRHREGGESRW